MASFGNMNQANAAPFWDFIQGLQEQGGNHPFFANLPTRNREAGEDAEAGPSNPWAGPWGYMGPFGGPGHRGGRRGHRGTPGPPGSENGPEHRGRHHGPPPPPGGPDSHRGPPPPFGGPHPRHAHEGHPRGPPPPFAEDEIPVDPPSRAPTPPTPEESVPETSGERDHRARHHNSHRRGGPWGGPRGGMGGFGRGGHQGPHRSCSGGRPFDIQNIDLGSIAQMFQSHLFGDNNAPQFRSGFPNNTTTNNDGSFQPAIDVFDTPSAYLIHASLPGAKKSDINITYSAANHSVTISGLIVRPAEVNEEMLDTLALDERQIGIFERLLRLNGNGQQSGTAVDVEGISAKLEDGVLRVEVPKIEDEWTEVKKVDIE